MTITHDALDLTIPLPRGHVELGPHCSGILLPPSPDKLVHYEVLTVGKWTVGILLECFLLMMDLYVVKLQEKSQLLVESVSSLNA